MPIKDSMIALIQVVNMPIRIRTDRKIGSIAPTNRITAAALNQANVPPAQFVQVVDYVPVALTADNAPQLVQFVREQTNSGVQAPARIPGKRKTGIVQFQRPYQLAFFRFETYQAQLLAGIKMDDSHLQGKVQFSGSPPVKKGVDHLSVHSLLPTGNYMTTLVACCSGAHRRSRCRRRIAAPARTAHSNSLSAHIAHSPDSSTASSTAK